MKYIVSKRVKISTATVDQRFIKDGKVMAEEGKRKKEEGDETGSVRPLGENGRMRIAQPVVFRLFWPQGTIFRSPAIVSQLSAWTPFPRPHLRLVVAASFPHRA